MGFVWWLQRDPIAATSGDPNLCRISLDVPLHQSRGNLIRAGKLNKRYHLVEERIARWYAKLQQLPKNILREIIEKYVKHPQSLRVLVKLLRHLAKFVPYLGQIITIILFIYDWYQGGFWHAAKGLIATNSAVRSPFSVAIKPQSASLACFVPKRLMAAQGQQA